jgi:hypothetical protein
MKKGRREAPFFVGRQRVQLAWTCLVLICFSTLMATAALAVGSDPATSEGWLSALVSRSVGTAPVVFLFNFFSAYDLAVFLRFKAGLIEAPAYLQLHDGDGADPPRNLTTRERFIVGAVFFAGSFLFVLAS